MGSGVLLSPAPRELLAAMPRVMTLSPHEFIRRFLMHVLPKASTGSATMASSPTAIAPPNVEPKKEQAAAPDEPRVQPCTCPRCGARMIIIEVFARGCEPRYRPAPAPTPMRIDTS